MESSLEYAIPALSHHRMVCRTACRDVAGVRSIGVSGSRTVSRLDSAENPGFGVPNNCNRVAFTVAGEGYRVASEGNQRGLCSRGEWPFYSCGRRTRRDGLPFGRAERWHVRTVPNSLARRKGKRWSAQASIRRWQSPAHPFDDIYNPQWEPLSGGEWGSLQSNRSCPAWAVVNACDLYAFCCFPRRGRRLLVDEALSPSSGRNHSKGRGHHFNQLERAPAGNTNR